RAAVSNHPPAWSKCQARPCYTGPPAAATLCRSHTTSPNQIARLPPGAPRTPARLRAGPTPPGTPGPAPTTAPGPVPAPSTAWPFPAGPRSSSHLPAYAPIPVFIVRAARSPVLGAARGHTAMRGTLPLPGLSHHHPGPGIVAVIVTNAILSRQAAPVAPV